MDIYIEHITVYSRGSDPKELLRDVSCIFKASRLTLLLGQNGAGKSTLLDVAAGLLSPDAGTVKYGDEPLWNGSRMNEKASRQSGIAFQFPEHQLFARTVQGEFDYSLRPLRLTREEAGRRVRQAMREVGLPEPALRQNPFTLSGGQQRRVAMGTVLSADPRWLLLDEATAGLDGEGLRQFAEQVGQWTRDGRGVVLATHDLDTFLPLADDVMIMENGRVTAFLTKEQLYAQPDVLLSAGLPLPESLRVTVLLGRQGWALPASACSAEQVAEMIALNLKQRKNTQESSEPNAESRRACSSVDEGTCQDRRKLPPVRTNTAAALEQEMISEETEEMEETEETEGGKPHEGRPDSKPDPRSVWLFCTLVSVGIFLQNSLYGLLASALVTAGAVRFSCVPVRRFWRALTPLLWLAGIAVPVSGIRGFGFSLEAASATFLAMIRILFVTAVGLLLPLQFSHLALKGSLEKALSFLGKRGVPVEAFSLYVSMLMRFIPLILSEWERFSKIGRARSKRGTKPGSVHVKDFPAIAVPFMMSLMRLAESAATAMEMRGYSGIGSVRASMKLPPMRRVDYVWITAGVAAFALLLWIRLQP